jgi:hypothetical protein
MKTGFPCHLMKIEFTQTFSDSVEIPMVALFNETVVSENEVRSWLEQGLFDVDSKPTVVVITQKQYENLFDHYTSTSEDTGRFYDDLRLEQQGGIV